MRHILKSISSPHTVGPNEPSWVPNWSIRPAELRMSESFLWNVLSKRLRERDESNEGIAFVRGGSELVIRGAVIECVTSRWQKLLKIVRLYDSIENPKHLNNIGILQQVFSKRKGSNDYRHSSDAHIECLFRQPTGPEYHVEQGDDETAQAQDCLCIDIYICGLRGEAPTPEQASQALRKERMMVAYSRLCNNLAVRKRILFEY